VPDVLFKFSGKFIPFISYSIHARIEGLAISPTNEQAQSCLRVCQWLSNCYMNIELFRFNERTGIVYILAGDDLEVEVLRDGNWRFL